MERKSERTELINEIKFLLKDYDHFYEEVGGEYYFQTNKDNKFLFSVEVNFDYTEIYSPLGHKLFNHDEQSFSSAVISLIKRLCHE